MSLAHELESMEGDLERALAEMPITVYVIDRDGRFRWLNDGARDLLGDVVGRRFKWVVAPDQLHLARKQFARKIIGEAATTEFDLTLLARDGRRVTLRINSVPLHGAGDIVGILAFGFPKDVVLRPEVEGRAAPTIPELTARQHEVLSLLGEGLGTREIARDLGVSEETTRNHIRALLRALGARSRLQAVITAYRFGLLDRSD
jgi:PAS domain S-box-containing protein